ncbi:MAG: hypothetical protein H0U85_08645 [Gemmatimonadales bacterium]|nr:hypothetical protein [Gemmatimonadales bacterium]
MLEPDSAPTCRVYIVELDPAVLSERKFVNANPRYVPGKLCLYVGSTALTPAERFANHRRGHKANRFVTRYGIRLRPDFYRHYPPMGRLEAELTEREAALELRAEGFGVWFNV